MASIGEQLSAAIGCHTSGDLQSAERLYREILQKEPKNAEALHLLGVIAHQVGKHDTAVELILRAVAVQPKAAVFHSNLGSAYQALGRVDEAIVSYRRAVQLNPEFPEAHGNLGNALHSKRQVGEAVAAYQRAIQLKPDYVEAHANLANALRILGKPEDAIASSERALQLRPNHAEAHFSRGASLRDVGRLDEATESLRRAVKAKPDFAEAHNTLGIALQERGEIAEAIGCYRKAIHFKPKYAEAYSNLGNLQRVEGEVEEAIAACRQALQLKPELAEAHGNLSNALLERGLLDEAIAACRAAIDIDPKFVKAHNSLGVALHQNGNSQEAVACFERALAIDPDDAEAHNNLAIVWLANAEFERGWVEYEWRWRTKQARSRDLAQPLWDGKPLDTGQVLLVHAEQGLGDTLQFMRYLPLVKRRVETVIFECHQPLRQLIAGISGVDQLIAKGDSLPAFDVQVPLMSLPRIFETDLETIPADVPYLIADAALVETWKEQLRVAEGLKIGICWQGNPEKALDQFRSIPLAQFGRLAEIPGVQLVSLQKGNGLEQAKSLDPPLPLIDFSDRLDEEHGPFMDTSAIMMALDLVITCDTAIAHLAGALGVPVWMASQYAPDWRWLRDRDDSPWYPSMRLFRQSSFGQWDSVFERIAEALRDEL